MATLTSSGITFSDTSQQNVVCAASANQAYVDVTASRATNTTYTNSTGRPIWVVAAIYVTVNGGGIQININGSGITNNWSLFTHGNPCSWVVPIGATYGVSGSCGVVWWSELS